MKKIILMIVAVTTMLVATGLVWGEGKKEETSAKEKECLVFINGELIRPPYNVYIIGNKLMVNDIVVADYTEKKENDKKPKQNIPPLSREKYKLLRNFSKEYQQLLFPTKEKLEYYQYLFYSENIDDTERLKKMNQFFKSKEKSQVLEKVVKKYKSEKIIKNIEIDETGSSIKVYWIDGEQEYVGVNEGPPMPQPTEEEKTKMVRKNLEERKKSFEQLLNYAIEVDGIYYWNHGSSEVNFNKKLFLEIMNSNLTIEDKAKKWEKEGQVWFNDAISMVNAYENSKKQK